MGDGPITFADGVVLGILLLSGIFALVRGFTREVLTIAAWGLSALILVLAYEPVQEWARDRILDGVVTDVMVASLLFLVPLVALSFASHSACKQVREGGVGVADRVLGFVFGVARGLAAIIILYWMYSLIEDPGDHPNWIHEAKLFPVVAESADFLGEWLPAVAARSFGPRFAGKAAGDSGERETVPQRGYARADRNALERLVLLAQNRDE
ncbi:MAG: CvpA family protein [Alphaproteobacteria bacterium]